MTVMTNISTNPPKYRPVQSNDGGTRALLQAGFWITLGGLLALLATKTVLGGIGIDGPHTNTGWIAFMFAMMGVPFGLLLLVLGGARWLRNRNRYPES